MTHPRYSTNIKEQENFSKVFLSIDVWCMVQKHIYLSQELQYPWLAHARSKAATLEVCLENSKINNHYAKSLEDRKLNF